MRFSITLKEDKHLQPVVVGCCAPNEEDARQWAGAQMRVWRWDKGEVLSIEVVPETVEQET